MGVSAQKRDISIGVFCHVLTSASLSATEIFCAPTGLREIGGVAGEINPLQRSSIFCYNMSDKMNCSAVKVLVYHDNCSHPRVCKPELNITKKNSYI